MVVCLLKNYIVRENEGWQNLGESSIKVLIIIVLMSNHYHFVLQTRGSGID